MYKNHNFSIKIVLIPFLNKMELSNDVNIVCTRLYIPQRSQHRYMVRRNAQHHPLKCDGHRASASLNRSISRPALLALQGICRAQLLPIVGQFLGICLSTYSVPKIMVSANRIACCSPCLCITSSALQRDQHLHSQLFSR